MTTGRKDETVVSSATVTPEMVTRRNVLTPRSSCDEQLFALEQYEAEIHDGSFLETGWMPLDNSGRMEARRSVVVHPNELPKSVPDMQRLRLRIVGVQRNT
eukprot:CAMPEP_0113845034 /NCGR_PEP_ID=MMETSP0372-20130328/543_1 /TAXON_ID=340204 /ORGANISM="Lankesteria abbotti" /LENGTH=100 /DNA_ID=CAMNT_0000814053 /DNA_START=144 /DNA_END=446 /DNA_ORIENTATION=+ /assembly_acc=CAM_ASM_000359